MFPNNIRKQVLATINARIDAGQKEFDDGAKEIDKVAKRQKIELQEKVVAKILTGK